MAGQGFILAPGEGRAVSLLGTHVAFKVVLEGDEGGLTFVEFTAQPGFSTGDHVHSRYEEQFYVVEGEFDFLLGEDRVRVGPGTFIRVPRGVAHGFSNPGDQPARVVGNILPAGYERYFEELAQLLAVGGRPDPAAIAQLRQKYDTEQVSSVTIGP